MDDHSLLILHGEDIAAAQQIVRDLPGCETCVFDPVLLDRAIAAGLPRVRFVAWPGAPEYAALHWQAHGQASALEARIDRAVAGALDGLVEPVPVTGWQHLPLYYLFMTLGWYTGLAAALIGGFQGRRLHVLVCDDPALYYFNSFIPALLLLHQAQAQGIAAVAYRYGGKPDTSRHLPLSGPPRAQRGTASLLTHLPTCMYDIRHFNEEFGASGKRVINLEARLFSMPVAANESIALAEPGQLADRIDPGWHAAADRIEAALTPLLEAFFTDKIPAASYRGRQVAQIAGTCRSQWLALQLLDRHFEHDPPSRLLLSDHDTGLHGPLLAFAERRQLPVLLLPHSKTTPDLDFACRNAVALTHPIQGDHILDATGRELVRHALALPVGFSASTRFPAPTRRVALLLNAFSLGGIPFAAYRPYVGGLRQIQQWCGARGLQLDLRCKPSYAMFTLLADELGLDAAALAATAAVPMAEFAARSDLCLMFDTPTAGAMEFLDRGIPILNPLITPLTRAQAVTTHPDVVPRETIDQALRRLQTFVDDPALLHQFGMRQFQRYVALFAGARALRSFL